MVFPTQCLLRGDHCVLCPNILLPSSLGQFLPILHPIELSPDTGDIEEHLYGGSDSNTFRVRAAGCLCIRASQLFISEKNVDFLLEWLFIRKRPCTVKQMEYAIYSSTAEHELASEMLILVAVHLSTVFAGDIILCLSTTYFLLVSHETSLNTFTGLYDIAHSNTPKMCSHKQREY